MSKFRKMVEEQIRHDRKTDGVFPSAKHGLSDLLEETTEFRDEIWEKGSKFDGKNAVRELVQVAAIAERLAEETLREHLDDI